MHTVKSKITLIFGTTGRVAPGAAIHFSKGQRRVSRFQITRGLDSRGHVVCCLVVTAGEPRDMAVCLMCTWFTNLFTSFQTWPAPRTRPS